MRERFPTRRDFLALGAAFAALAPSTAPAAPGPEHRRIPSTGEPIPAVGLGTWITFNVGTDPVLRDACADVMAAFFAAGGRMIDSSPMYGSSQAVVGYGLGREGRPDRFVAADKVWTSSGTDGPGQIEESLANWGVPRFELLQVHNLLAWEAHLPMLREMKAAGLVTYIGVTTSHGRRHDLLEQVMRQWPLDFVQLTYNVLDREAEHRLLPLAQDRGIAVIVNRPFRQGALTERLKAHRLPGWAADVGATTWAQLILKFILSHPAVTTVIPATTRPDHARENIAAANGLLPDAALRERIAGHIRQL